MFTRMMRKYNVMNDQVWYQLLKDVLNYEGKCSENYLGVNHVDFPAMIGSIKRFARIYLIRSFQKIVVNTRNFMLIIKVT